MNAIVLSQNALGLDPKVSRAYPEVPLIHLRHHLRASTLRFKTTKTNLLSARTIFTKVQLLHLKNTG